MDFEQESLSVDQISDSISRIIQRAINNNSLTADIEVPLNTKKLDYLKLVNPFDVPELKNASTSSMTHYNRPLHVYKYGDFYISTHEDTKVDQQNVYYAVRSLEILKTRYPEAYKKLFVDSKDFLAEEPKYGNWLNRNKAFWIGFNSDPSGFSSNNHFFITDKKTPKGKSTSVNIAVANLHECKIMGKSYWEGSRPVYNRDTDSANYHLQLREGLLVSIVHEMMHNYIQYASAVSDNFQNAVSIRSKILGTDAEEAVIVNTSYMYFAKKGGLMPEQPAYYYSNVFDRKMSDLKKQNLRTSYAKHYSTTIPTDTNLRDVFVISGILD
jgi:hypothetical protein